jgi:hypothetical protein
MTEIERLRDNEQKLRLLKSTKASIVNTLLAEHTAKIRREPLVAQGALKDAEIASKNAATPPEVDAATANLTTRQNAVAFLEGELRCLES